MPAKSQAELYRERKLSGLCPRCGGEKPEADRVNCTSCLFAIREATRRRESNGRLPTKKRYVLSGKCYSCGARPPEEGRKNCRLCLDKVKDKYRARKASGVCTYCGVEKPASETTNLCVVCRSRECLKLARRTEEMRLKVMEAYGGPVCACCGEEQMEFLTIDHIGGGGNKQRKELKNQVIPWIIKNGFPPGFRVLCMNCNWAIGKYGYCPHKPPVGTTKHRCLPRCERVKSKV